MDIFVKVLTCIMVWSLILISIDELQKMDDLITVADQINDRISQIQGQPD